MARFKNKRGKMTSQQQEPQQLVVHPTAATAPMPGDLFGPGEWATILAIADAFAPPVNPEVIRGQVSTKYGASVEEYAQQCPSKLGELFKDNLRNALRNAPPENPKQLRLVLKILGNRATAMFLTGSATLLTDMSLAQREAVLRSWRDSRLAPLRKLFRSLYDVLTVSFVRPNQLAYKAMGHPEFEPKLHHPELFTNRNFFRIPILNLGEHAKTAEMEVDVVIVGSGAGSGVVASRLTRAGYSVLVLEKGKYFHQEELQFNEDTGYANLYESGGSMITEDGSMLVLAGATLGGATTVNWSASLRTPDNIRREWVERGVKFYGERVYDEAMDYVMEMMGCSDENLEHSFTNQIIMDGAKKLGYAAKNIPQNSGGNRHACGFCCFGCRFGEKQGGVVCWLRDAVEHGAKIIDRTDVLSVVHSHGKASGVKAVVRTDTTTTKLNVKARMVVVSGGSLSTPGVLQRSKFKNKRIGRGLTLHPCSVVYGEFPDKDVNAFDETIMTAVCTEVDNLDGKGHGPKIEAILHQPATENHFYPWSSGAQWRQDNLRYNHLAALLIITRDNSEGGQVYYNKERPLQPRLNFTPSKFDMWALNKGMQAGADLLYIEGAPRIFVPLVELPAFESSKPKEERSINDADFKQWKARLNKMNLEPLQLALGSAHQMSSCRMSGKGPKYAPVNDRGQLWECKNVFVADASVLPTASGVNPMISVMATSHVIAGNVIAELGKSAQPRL